jgi:hypothetical protein
MLGSPQFVLVLSVLTVLIHWTNAIFSGKPIDDEWVIVAKMDNFYVQACIVHRIK